MIGKFRVLDSNGNSLFDNTNLSDDSPKICGGKFRKVDDKYSLVYIDADLVIFQETLLSILQILPRHNLIGSLT